MSSRSPLTGLLTSLKTSAVLLVVLALMLLLGIVLPQESVLGEEGFQAVVQQEPLMRFLLVSLGLGRLATSGLFLVVLACFFLNLTAVLASRLGPTWRRVRMKTRSEAGIQAWAQAEAGRERDLPGDWSLGFAVQTLRGFGFQVRRLGDGVLWGVKHRTAPLGFLLFHLSFFLLTAGGALLYYTRFVGSVLLSEGQEFEGEYREVARESPLGRRPDLRFTLVEVDARFAQSQPVHLSAELRFRRAGGSVPKRAEINQPARWGSAVILVQQAGLTPVFWLQDARGFTLDRVAVPARAIGDQAVFVPIHEDRYLISINPLDSPDEFPDTQGLRTTSLYVQVFRGEELVYEGHLRPGSMADLGGDRIVLEEIRRWAGFQVVAERGGGLLIMGFLLGVVGLVWRMLWYRREVAVVWDEASFRLVGRSEYYGGRFEEELSSIDHLLAEGPSKASANRNAGLEVGEP